MKQDERLSRCFPGAQILVWMCFLIQWEVKGHAQESTAVTHQHGIQQACCPATGRAATDLKLTFC